MSVLNTGDPIEYASQRTLDELSLEINELMFTLPAITDQDRYRFALFGLEALMTAWEFQTGEPHPKSNNLIDFYQRIWRLS